MYTKARCVNTASTYRGDLVGAQFFTATNAQCFGGIFTFGLNCKPGETQDNVVPSGTCDISYTVVTFNWTHIPTGKSGTVQTPRHNYDGKDMLVFTLRQPANIAPEFEHHGVELSPVVEIASA